MNLVEWTTNYIKHRDLFFKKIKSIDVKDKLITVKFKDKITIYKIVPVLEDPLLQWIVHEKHCVVVCSYAQSNLEFILKHWEALSKHNSLLIIFADAKTGKKLLLNPQTHNKIAEPETLKQGIITLFTTGKEV